MNDPPNYIDFANALDEFGITAKRLQSLIDADYVCYADGRVDRDSLAYALFTGLDDDTPSWLAPEYRDSHRQLQQSARQRIRDERRRDSPLRLWVIIVGLIVSTVILWRIGLIIYRAIEYS